MEEKQYIKKYVFGIIYRLPSYISDDVKTFINEFKALLNGLSIRYKSVYLCGDYNIKYYYVFICILCIRI